MALVNLKIARALSRKRFAERVKTKEYQKKKQELELHLTFTSNNIFVNFCNGVGETIFVKTFGIIGYNGVKRRTRYALYFFGLEVGELLVKYLKEPIYEKKKLTLVLQGIFLKADFRYRRFMDGIKKYKIGFSGLRTTFNTPYNGCSGPKHRRTRRFRRFN